MTATVPAAGPSALGATATSVQRYAEAAARAGRTAHAARFQPRALHNPLYRTQLVHARLCRVLVQAAELGVGRSGLGVGRSELGVGRSELADGGPQSSDDQSAIRIGALLRATESAAARSSYATTRALDELSTALLGWLDEAGFWPAEEAGQVTPEHETRCALAERSRIVLSSSLAALGIPAEERI